MWKGVNAISRSLFEMEELFDELSVAGQSLLKSLRFFGVCKLWRRANAGRVSTVPEDDLLSCEVSAKSDCYKRMQMIPERNVRSLHMTILVRGKLEMTKGRWVSLLEIKYWTAGWLLLEWLVTWLVNAYGEELVADQEELELRRKKKESVQRSLTNMEISEWKWSKAKEPHFGFRCRNRSNVRRQVRSNAVLKNAEVLTDSVLPW